MTLNLTPKQFDRWWFFIRLWMGPKSRKAVLKIYQANKKLIKQGVCLEIVVGGSSNGYQFAA